MDVPDSWSCTPCSHSSIQIKKIFYVIGNLGAGGMGGEHKFVEISFHTSYMEVSLVSACHINYKDVWDIYPMLRKLYLFYKSTIMEEGRTHFYRQ